MSLQNVCDRCGETAPTDAFVAMDELRREYAHLKTDAKAHGLDEVDASGLVGVSEGWLTLTYTPDVGEPIYDPLDGDRISEPDSGTRLDLCSVCRRGFIEWLRSGR